MPVITIKDPTLLERLKRIKPQPAEDSFDDVIYELLKKAESKGEGKPKLSGLDDLPRLVAEEVKRALDGQLVETIRSALLPAVSGLDIEIPVQLSIRVRVRLEPVFDVTPSETHVHVENHNAPLNNESTNGAGDKTASIDELERRALELVRQRGGCWNGSAYSLAKHIVGAPNDALEKRLKRRLIRKDSKLCLPEAAQA